MANLNRCRPGGRSRRQAMIGGKWGPQGTIAAPYRFGMTMILGVGLVKWGISPCVPMVARLLTEIAIGMIVYASTVFILHRNRVLTFLRQIKSVRQARA